MIYLARFGKVSGPYTSEQVAQMRQTGEIHQYFWIWEAGSTAWMPIDPPPAPPQGIEQKLNSYIQQPQPQVYQAQPQVQAPRPQKSYSTPKSLQVICYDSFQIASGDLTQVFDSGCEFLCKYPNARNTFSPDAQVRLDLLDTKTGRSMNLVTRIRQVTRKDGRWCYRLEWEQLPELIA